MTTTRVEPIRKLFAVDQLKLRRECMARHSDADTKRLAASIERDGPLHMPSVLESGDVLAGTGRCMAYRLLGLKEAMCNVFPNSLPKLQRLSIEASENLTCVTTSPYDRYMYCMKALEIDPNQKLKDLAVLFHCDASNITRWLAAQKLIPPLFELFQCGRLGTEAAYQLSLKEPDEQHADLPLILNGTTVSELRSRGRSKPNSDSETKKFSRVRLALPGGTVTVAAEGDGISLKSMLDMMSKLVEDGRREEKRGVSATTWAKSLKDRLGKKDGNGTAPNEFHEKQKNGDGS